MAPKEPTRHQLSSRLQYNQQTPAFLQKLQNRIQGVPDDDDEEPEYYDDGSGRPPIPQRPAIPERPDDDPGSADEDDGDEKPQVVVLREGKHLTEREAENVRRKEKGLPPLPDPGKDALEVKGDGKPLPELSSKSKQKTPNLSFSSAGGNLKASSSKLKRKVIGDADGSDSGEKPKKMKKKKVKKPQKGLLSFADGDDG
ncbi:hypothetical protein BV22DRAFT_1135802 [Leucogyrophana mollusca]|uniref:Uncharacterized protein n=1 Tax=Leucogyrophana mollusca TaxID=85980 RepID=A0ACB8AUQ4_9AGAM|nr:hypothetical protein BV22DRAFT_1135802 [Leucogyrophana mollusca]